MATFLGQYSATIDDKGRVVLPSAFKKVLVELGQDSVVVERNRRTKCVDILTVSAWRKQVDEFIAKLKPGTNPMHDKLQKEYFKTFTTINVAANGRINIPNKYMEYAGFENKVEFLGMKDFIRLTAIKEEVEVEMSDAEYLEMLRRIEEGEN